MREKEAKDIKMTEGQKLQCKIKEEI